MFSDSGIRNKQNGIKTVADTKKMINQKVK